MKFNNDIYKTFCENNFTFSWINGKGKKHLSGNTAVSYHIVSCSVCKNTKKSVNDFKIVKQCYSKLETTISEAVLLKRFSPSLNRQPIKPGITHT